MRRHTATPQQDPAIVGTLNLSPDLGDSLVPVSGGDIASGEGGISVTSQKTAPTRKRGRPASTSPPLSDADRQQRRREKKTNLIWELADALRSARGNQDWEAVRAVEIKLYQL